MFGAFLLLTGSAAAQAQRPPAIAGGSSPGAVSVAFGDGIWSKIDIFAPPAANNYSAVYDPVRDRLIVIGGGSSMAAFALQLQGEPSWQLIAVIGGSPPRRNDQSLIYDPVRDRVIMFGGDFTNETWALSLSGTPSWVQILPSGPLPPPRSRHSAIYDPVRDRMVIFAGYDNQTWALSLSGTPQWTQLSPSGTLPVPRWGHSAVYDPVGDRMVVFGGNLGYAGNYTNEVWTLSLGGAGSWTQITPTGGPPSPRAMHAAVVDAHGRMVVYGGYAEQSIGYETFLYRPADAWALSLGDLVWSMLSPSGIAPLTRDTQAGAYDSRRDQLIFFGGHSNNPDRGGPLLRDAQSLTLSGSPHWNALLNIPPAQEGHSAIFDPVRDRMIVQGGLFGADPEGIGYFDGETWSLELAGAPRWIWTAVLPRPRGWNTLTYDPMREDLVIVGGTYDIRWGCGRYPGPMARYPWDAWAFPLGGNPTWSALPSNQTYQSHSAIFDPRRDRVLVFGGVWIEFVSHCIGNPCDYVCYSVNHPNNDVWALDLSGNPSWTKLNPSGASPDPRWGHKAVYDPIRDRMIVFSGTREPYSSANDLWALSLNTDPPQWSQLTPSGTAPSGRTGYTAVYDEQRDRIVIFGGTILAPNLAGHPTNQVWALNLSPSLSWTLLSPTGQGPVALTAHTSVYDPIADRMVVFGGVDNVALTDGLWTLTWGFPTAVLASFIRSRVEPNLVRLEWQLSTNSAGSIAVYRMAPDGPWENVGQATLDGASRVFYEDHDVSPGARYGYRLGIPEGDREIFAGEAWVDVPVAPRFALRGPVRNPSSDRVAVSFSLPNTAPASLELIDLQGRIVARVSVGALGPGDHVVDLAGSPPAPGLYLIRLDQAGRSATSRVAIVR